MGRKSAWASLLLAIALLSAGCSRVASDDQITTNIKARMFSDARLQGSSLQVTVKGGVATLSGKVPSVAARYEAFKAAAETPGVKKVNDQMTVQEAPSPQVAASTPPPESQPRRRGIGRHRDIRPAEPASADTAPAPSPETTQPAQPPPGETTAASSQPPASAAPAPEPASPPPPPIEQITIPQGTLVSVRMIDSVDSATNRAGDILHAALANPIAVGDKVVMPKGTDVYLRLVEARSAGHLTGQSELRLELYRIQLLGRSYLVVSNDYDVKGASRGKRSALAVIAGSAIGAAIGAIAGGGKGAAIGAASGGGGGAIYQGATKSQQVRIPSESLLNFQLGQPLTITVSSDASPPDSQP